MTVSVERIGRIEQEGINEEERKVPRDEKVE